MGPLFSSEIDFDTSFDYEIDFNGLSIFLSPSAFHITELEEANKAVAKVLAQVLDRSTSEKASRGTESTILTRLFRGAKLGIMQQKTIAAKHSTKC